MSQSLFAELNGFVLFDKTQFDTFIRQHNLKGNLLKKFATSNLGDMVSESGTAIPITDISPEHYLFCATNNSESDKYLAEDQIKVRSDGWVLYSETGSIMITGLGYLYNYKATKLAKYITLNIARGWNDITIVGGIKDEELIYEILYKPTNKQPSFRGDFNISLDFI